MKTLLLIFAIAVSAEAQTRWIGTWAAAPAPQLEPAEMQAQKLVFKDQTVREIVHTSLGGETVRVRLSNAFNAQPVEIGAAFIGQNRRGVPLTFSGRPRVEIPANAVVLSDPVELKFAAGSNLAVSLYLPNETVAGGVHYAAQQTNYIANGNVVSEPSLTIAGTFTSWVFLTGVDILVPESAGSIVAFGDSITDGARSTVDANHRWPDTLASRLLERKGILLSVVDMGIGGNRILHEGSASKRPQFGINALARFDQDVLAQPGVKYLVILEGINDIGHAGSSAPASEAVTAEDLIAGQKQMIARAHEKGIKVIGATLTPFEGEANIKRGYWTPEKAKVREALNQWIRTSKDFDGFIDFDKAVRDPKSPNKMLPRFDSGDQLHPNDAGYKAMGEAVPLNLFN